MQNGIQLQGTYDQFDDSGLNLDFNGLFDPSNATVLSLSSSSQLYISSLGDVAIDNTEGFQPVQTIYYINDPSDGTEAAVDYPV